jgi:hypothetical protein
MPGKLLTLDASLNRIPELFHTAEVMSLVDNVGLSEHPKALDFFKPDVIARAAELRVRRETTCIYLYR